ncbi:hypothetical protein PPTG_19908 [Phytophthora nicotianae INRA-310]|uniref:Uncharacterized protein n=1 Tax=Phytophthora nicotianae (strain INRA-310) TaxID=761204 RepID=W2PAV7_PHYN3|nr:hypothetical protein PPTG_19908 [Phytophthora nicotianae INRA-310]ETM97961.1 hypothetical protein PPTG_19908 [Phytophthora nicotianae INRA-310]
MLMVDVWVLVGHPDDFLQWARRTVPTLIGANAIGTCLFNALQQAVQLLGEPSAVPDAEVERFLADADKRGADLSRGVRWKVFKAFLVQLSVLDRAFHSRTLSTIGSVLDTVVLLASSV